MGRSADEIATSYGLEIADVYAALAYYFNHREEIDASAEADADLIAEMRQAIPSKLGRSSSDHEPNG
jgi:hypothetical protein